MPIDEDNYMFLYHPINAEIYNMNPIIYFNHLDNLEPELEMELDLPKIKLLITSEESKYFHQFRITTNGYLTVIDENGKNKKITIYNFL